MEYYFEEAVFLHMSGGKHAAFSTIHQRQQTFVPPGRKRVFHSFHTPYYDC